jgi:hypothetical protein
MKLKRTVLLAAFLVALGLLLGTNPAQATVKFDSNNPTQAIGIENLAIGNTLFNVNFTPNFSAERVYGKFPGTFDFTTDQELQEAVDAVSIELNLAGAQSVGATGSDGLQQYLIGFDSQLVKKGIPAVFFYTGEKDANSGSWGLGTIHDLTHYELEFTIWADFTEAGSAPVTIGGTVTGLEGSGLVLRNNGSDDETIDGDGGFTFDMPLIPGTSYNVTVFTQPEGQICSVEFGSGTVPDEAVTNVAVSCADEPDPVTIGGTVTGLEGSGLVLQNNGSDDLTIDADDEFTFDTPLKPDTSYDVTVYIHPEGQICSVENGSGTVPAEAVTNVAVSCAEAPVATVSKVAAEGDTLLDDTILMDILLDGGVAINLYGEVAFGGRDADSGNDAVFTQAGKVVEEGGTLTDDNILVRIKGPGQVAISAGDTVAFHGEAEEDFSTPEQPYSFAAVFTQDGVVAAVGDTVGGLGTLDWIYTTGKVAINNYNEVAFHGKVGDLRTVFISDGLETESEIYEDAGLADNTILKFITQSGGVAINDMGEVAFHGRTVDPDSSPQSLPDKAVLTSKGLVVARVGDSLPNDYLLADINVQGGVAINLFGEVAFLGFRGAAQGGTPLPAVFTSNGLVARVYVTLADDTMLEDIDTTAGVAINVYGDVVFHGRTGGEKAVFTQNGLVAKVGDILADGTTLTEIHPTAGVAINPFGREVAFLGKVNTNNANAVFVGQAPLPPSILPTEGDKTDSE